MNPSRSEQVVDPSDVLAFLRIRPMRIEDLPAVHQIDHLSFSLPWPESSFRYELLENPRSLQRVAEMDLSDGQPQVVGETVVWLILDEAHIATIAVHPDFRGRGIAHRLLAEVLGIAISQGANQATLEVRENNHTARNLYHRFGFTVMGRRLRYYKDNNEDALIMTVNNLGEAYLTWLKNGGWQAAGFGQRDQQLHARILKTRS